MLWEWKKELSAGLFRRIQIQNKKIQVSRFINAELESDSDSESDSEAELKSDTELMAKLESGSESE